MITFRFWCKQFKLNFVTNNAAEIWAVRQGLLIAWELGYKFINLQIDSKIVICWLTSNETMALAIAPIIYDCKALLSRALTILLCHIFYETNSITDSLAKKWVIQRSILVEYAMCPREKSTPKAYFLTSLNGRLYRRKNDGPTFINNN